MAGSRRSTLDRVRSGHATDVGRVRDHNEDSLLDAAGAWFVADGLGGHAAGEVASRIAVEVLGELAEQPADGPEGVAALVRRANDGILAAQREDRDRAGMGTTLTGLTLVGPDDEVEWAVVNVGDSRVYRIDAGGIEQLTRDHSEVAELVDAGLLDPADVPFHPMRNIITRSLGATPDVVPDTWVRPVVPGETFVLCSDGLSNELDDETIHALVAAADDPQAAADALVAAALEAGGRDNVTVVVVTVDPE
jgi:serine/threonine protein phosphatase PrpC